MANWRRAEVGDNLARVKNATLRQLRTFVTVARRQSFSRAAEELHLTQPAVSEHIKQLEMHVGAPLFEKLGKRIFLTLAGTEMLRHSHDIIDQFAKAEAAMEHVRIASENRLRVGMITAGGYLFPHLLGIFMQKHQDVELEVTVQNHDQLVQRLDDNLTDIAVLVNASKSAAVINQTFAPHPFVVVASPTHPLARSASIPLDVLAQERFLVREEGSDTWQVMKHSLLDKINGPVTTIEIASTEAIKQAVMAGLGVSFLSSHTISAELDARALVVLDVEHFPVMDHWQIAYRSDKHLSGIAQAFKNFLLKEGAEHIARVLRPSAASVPDSALSS